MDEQQPSIVLLQSTLQQSQSFFMIAEHSVDASQIHGRNMTPLGFAFQAAQNQKCFFLTAVFYECPSKLCLSFQRFACEAHALFVCGNRLRKHFAPLIREAQVHVDTHIVRIESDGLPHTWACARVRVYIRDPRRPTSTRYRTARWPRRRGLPPNPD